MAYLGCSLVALNSHEELFKPIRNLFLAQSYAHVSPECQPECQSPFAKQVTSVKDLVKCHFHFPRLWRMKDQIFSNVINQFLLFLSSMNSHQERRRWSVSLSKAQSCLLLDQKEKQSRGDRERGRVEKEREQWKERKWERKREEIEKERECVCERERARERKRE